MANIIREKSLGSSAWYANSRPGNPALPDENQRKFTKPSRIKGYVILSLLCLLILCFGLWLYCRVNPSGGKGDTDGETVVSHDSESPSLDASVSRHIPDLQSIKDIVALEYPDHTLQGIFWKDKEFDGNYFLSFDDGPNLEKIPFSGGFISINESILNVLNEYNLKAVFFINGNKLEYNDLQEKEALRYHLVRIIHEGHLLGNHSYNHYNLSQGKFIDGESDKQELAEEYILTQNALNDILGFDYPLVLVRPPFAEAGRTRDLDIWLTEEKKYLVSLQFDSYDYAFSSRGIWNAQSIPQRIINIMTRQKEGGVILLHELPGTAAFLPGLLEDLIFLHKIHFEGIDHQLKKKYGRKFQESPAVNYQY